MQEQTGCDGFMIARGAQGNPWIFSQILHYFETGEHQEKPSFEEVRRMILRHARMMIEFKGEYTGTRDEKAHSVVYGRISAFIKAARGGEYGGELRTA